MRGSMFKRKGRKTWSVIIDLGRDPGTKRRKQKWHNGYKTKRAAERAMVENLSQLERQEYVPPSKMTVRSFLVDEWLPTIEHTIRPSTFAVYRAIANGHVLP